MESLTPGARETALMNKKPGLKDEEVNKIIISTRGPVKRGKK